MTIDSAPAALAFVRRHGVVLESARGPVPSLAAAIAGGPIAGSWWSHPRGKAIFALTRAVRDAPDVLTCRLIDDKITFLHRRLWPALVRLAPAVPAARLAAIREVHAPDGRHRLRQTPFPQWVPADVAAAADQLTEAEARALVPVDLDR